MQTIVEGLGWPSSKPETNAGAEQWHTSPVLRGSSQRSSEDELRYQTLTLQVVSWHYAVDSLVLCELLQLSRSTTMLRN